MKLWAAIVAPLLLSACAPALRTPPDLLELAQVDRPARTGRFESLLNQAHASFAERTLDSVSESVRLSLLATTADPERTEGLQQAVRASAWLIDHEDDSALKKQLALRAVQAAQWCEKIDPDDPACQYWLAVSMGLQARERRTTGLDALPRIESAFLLSEKAIPEFELGGPARALALFYVRAPGWPSGPGDPDEGLRFARKAEQIAPGHPPNLLALAESLDAIGEKEEARRWWLRAREMAARSESPDADEWSCQASRHLGEACGETP